MTTSVKLNVVVGGSIPPCILNRFMSAIIMMS